MRAFAVMSADVNSGALVLTLRGPLTMPAVGAAWVTLGRCLAHFPRAVIVDLARVVVVSAAPAVLLPAMLRRRGRLRGLSVLVHGAAPALAARLASGRGALALYRERAAAVAAARALPAVPGAQRVQARFEPVPQAPAQARELVERTCREWQLEHLVDDAQLIISELVSNAVEHAGTDIDVTIRCHRGLLRLGVCDRSPAAPTAAVSTRAAGGPVALRGRGLPMVALQAHAWGTIHGDGGKIVWAALTTAVPA